MKQFDEQKGHFFQSPCSSLSAGENIGAKLLLQHRYLSELMRGILPPLLEPSWGSDVLAIGWCAGGLAYEIAWRYPSMQVTGIERNASLVEQAQTLVKSLGNATVFEQDIHHLDDKMFSSASFDLIHLRFLTGEVTLEQFPALMQTLARFCRTRGSLVWTETDLPITTSPACQQLSAMVEQALLAGGDAFAPGNSTLVTSHMDRWLSDAGFRIAQSKIYAIDISRGSKGHDAFVRQVEISREQVRAYLLEKEVMTAAAFEEVFLAMQQEIQQENFYGMLYLRTLVGIKL